MFFFFQIYNEQFEQGSVNILIKKLKQQKNSIGCKLKGNTNINFKHVITIIFPVSPGGHFISKI